MRSTDPGMLRGHLWTIAPNLRHQLRPLRAPASEPWSTIIDDPQVGPVQLTGELQHTAQRDAICVLVHGLGGSIDSQYMIRAASVLSARGVGCLRLGLRGADRQGDDFYHAGLTTDLEAAIASPQLADYQRVYVLGYSLGGHMTLRSGLAPQDSRVRAVASICAPLDLAASAMAIDHPRRRVYCNHVLAGLKEIYREVAERRPVPTPWPIVEQLKTIREWDRHVVVPRHGFASVDDYYDSQSAGPRLADIHVPAMIVACTGDPMIPPPTLHPSLSAPLPDHVHTHWVRGGGHVAYPARVKLGQPGPRGIEHQILTWMERQ